MVIWRSFIPSICLDAWERVNKNATVTRQYTVNPERRRAMKKRRLEVLKRYREIAKDYPKGKPGALSELARELGLSRERTRQLVREAEAMRKRKPKVDGET
jgi:DNA-directed RNA polymerase sigma subunit (sigma70/sigma32)